MVFACTGTWEMFDQFTLSTAETVGSVDVRVAGQGAPSQDEPITTRGGLSRHPPHGEAGA
jgi:hypothetical protein